MAVLVWDKRKRPLMPCSEKRARKLLGRGRAVVVRLHPFTIRLKDRRVEDSRLQPLRLKIDPGSHRLAIPKTHALDAACVGPLASVTGWRRPTLAIRATGRGAYQRTRLTAHGFPRGYLTRRKRHFGFQTGDRVRAEAPRGRKAGVHVGRVAVRASGSFNIQTPAGLIQGIGHRYCRLLQRADGYAYQVQPQPIQEGGTGPVTALRAVRSAFPA